MFRGERRCEPFAGAARLVLLASCMFVFGCNTARARSRTHLADLSQPLELRRPVREPGAAGAPTTARAPESSADVPTGCPAEMVQVAKYCIDRYEAVLVVRGEDGREVAHPAHEMPVKGVRYEARSKAGVLPQGYISQVSSDAACRNAGKRLCSVSEWYTACRGSKQTTYPYGDTYVKDACNSGKAHLLGRMYGNNARLWTYDHFNDPRLNREPGFLSPTGSHSDCTNDSGAYDMIGNLHEWVGDRVEPSLAEKVHLVDGVRAAIPRNTGHVIFMGGFFSTTAEQGPGCDFTTLGHETQYHDYSTGFRCCKDL